MTTTAHKQARRADALLALVLTMAFAAVSAAQDNKPTRLLDRAPFDRVTLREGNVTFDVQLLDLPARKVPRPLPASGQLELRRLSDPSVLYAPNWSAISRIQLYEQILLAEAKRLARGGKLLEAYEYLAFLHKNYPDLRGLGQATQDYLRDDAGRAFKEGQYEDALAILLSLYDLNPNHPTLKNAVRAVSDRMIRARLADNDYDRARGILNLVKESFRSLNASNVPQWEQRFASGAQQQLTRARAALAERDFAQAREAVRAALAILPSARGASALQKQIDEAWPQVTVAVAALAPESPEGGLVNRAAARVAGLLQDRLVNLEDFGSEGGIYRSNWAVLEPSTTGQELTVTLNDAALSRGVTPHRLALGVLAAADPSAADPAVNLAAALDRVAMSQGRRVSITWHRPHIRPEPLLDLPVSQICGEQSTAFRPASRGENTVDFLARDGGQAGPKAIQEIAFETDAEALQALVTGRVDVLDRVPPWQVDSIKRQRGLKLVDYRLPTVHALLLNYENPLLGRAEFRRAIVYGIDRGQILSDILLAGQQQIGFQVVSGPMPAGVTLTDPVGYGYSRQINPRPYEPRLAALLAGVARSAVTKQHAAANADQDGESAGPPPPDVMRPLVLAHTPDPLATTACQSMRLQLGAIGIPVELRTISPDRSGSQDYDLIYAEVSIREPLVDARRLLGPKGLAGRCAPAMSVLLDQLDRVENWEAARKQLAEIHQIAHNDLPVIPLWQTVNRLAHTARLSGVGAAPVTLYQNVDEWKIQPLTGAAL